ncbi:MAG TPA: ATP-binding protein [Bryobacteraceae bacterium]|jgi:signal transduction histidine kinase
MKTRQPEENKSGGKGIGVLDLSKGGAAQRARLSALAASGFCVHPASAGQAVEAAAAHKPDIVLLSLGTPGSQDADGVEICRRLKAGSENVPIVVLFVSAAKSGASPPQSALAQCGADLCLPANLAPVFLADALRSLFRMRGAERELEQSRGELIDFSRQIAHDIEGPLRGVVTFAELIGSAHPLSVNERTYLGHVLSSADQVRRLARGFLSYAEAKRQQPRLTAVPLRGVVVAAVQALRERIKESSAVVETQDLLPSALGDFSAIQQVFQHLITNAINYRRPNSSPSISIGVRQQSAGVSVIFVSDDGMGVPPQYQQSIFAPFKRLHGLDIPGAGIGLAICKQIVEAHGGRIWVESEAGSGSSFLFTLRTPG